jgi:CRISPR-associated protein Cas5t
MISLYVDAPFAVCRTFSAGWFRPTATFLTPSAAYGLILNIAGIESRLLENDPQHPATVPATLTRKGLPHVRIALGASAVRRIGQALVDVPEPFRYPRVQTVYQQLHNYPVGTSGGERAATTFGSKYNITPVRRELLVNLVAVIAVDGNSDLENRICRGLSGEFSANRYGLPFLGDNAFLPDRIELLRDNVAAHWYERVTADDSELRPRTTRLTIVIDRADMSRTRSALYAPIAQPSIEIPPDSWTLIEPEP